jgi:hypothetical protein
MHNQSQFQGKFPSSIASKWDHCCISLHNAGRRSGAAFATSLTGQQGHVWRFGNTITPVCWILLMNIFFLSHERFQFFGFELLFCF